MPIADFKGFYDKYAGHGTSAEDIAKAENITVQEAQEAKDFIRRYTGFKPEAIVKMWDEAQYNKTHPYVPPAQDPNAVKGAYGATMTQRTIAMLPEQEYWDKMERLIARVIDN